MKNLHTVVIVHYRLRQPQPTTIASGEFAPSPPRSGHTRTRDWPDHVAGPRSPAAGYRHNVARDVVGPRVEFVTSWSCQPFLLEQLSRICAVATAITLKILQTSAVKQAAQDKASPSEAHSKCGASCVAKITCNCAGGRSRKNTIAAFAHFATGRIDDLRIIVSNPGELKSGLFDNIVPRFVNRLFH